MCVKLLERGMSCLFQRGKEVGWLGLTGDWDPEGKRHRNQWEGFELFWAGRWLLGGDAPGTKEGEELTWKELVCVCGPA